MIENCPFSSTTIRLSTSCMFASWLRSGWNMCIGQSRLPKSTRPANKPVALEWIQQLMPQLHQKKALPEIPFHLGATEMSSIKYLRVHCFLARLWCWWGFRYIHQMLVHTVHTSNHKTVSVSRDIGEHLWKPQSSELRPSLGWFLDTQNLNHGVTWLSRDTAPAQQSAHCQRFALQKLRTRSCQN